MSLLCVCAYCPLPSDVWYCGIYVNGAFICTSIYNGYPYSVIDLKRKHCALKPYLMIDIAGEYGNIKPYFMIDMADAYA